MKRFSWGKVLANFKYDFDGHTMEIVKYHPWKSKDCTILVGNPDEAKTAYHCAELRESSESLQYMLLAWMAYKNLGLNQRALVNGVAKAMGVYDAPGPAS